jgi:hypothetical protein
VQVPGIRFPEKRTKQSAMDSRCETVLGFDRMTGFVPDISPRHRFEARIAIRLRRGERKLNLQGWVRDLSESGLRAFVADPLEPGESVVFEIPFPDIEKEVIPAKVVRALGTDYGFAFTALSAEQRNHIQTTLRNCPALPRPQTGATIWS